MELTDALRDLAQRQSEAWLSFYLALTDSETPAPEPAPEPEPEPTPEPTPEPVPPAELTLTHLGTVRLPPEGTTYAREYQALAAVEGEPNSLWITRGRRVGKITLAEPALGDPRNSPMATWALPTVPVGQTFVDAVVAANQPSYYAKLNGIAQIGDRLWINYGQYYHVQPTQHDHLNSISTSLDPATESPLVKVAADTRSTAGGMVAVPPGWVDGGSVLARLGYWQNGNDGGPRISLTDIAADPPAFRYATSYKMVWQANQTNSIADRTLSDLVDNVEWSTWDNWQSVCFLTAPTGEKHWGVFVRKGTAPGWYGSGALPAGNTTNTADACSWDQGGHAHPYHAALWLFRDADIQAVLRGEATTSSPKPVRKIKLDGMLPCARLAGVAVVGDLIWAVEELVHFRTFADTEVERVNCLRAYRFSWN